MSRVARALGAVVVATALSSCGAASPTGGTTGATDGASFGVDRAPWPGDVEGARALLAALPEDLASEARDDMAVEAEFEEEFAFVSYGEGRTSVMASDGDFDGVPVAETDAQDKLAAMFGLGYGCDVDTYEGTIAPDGIVPGAEPVEDGAVAWFACRIDGAEGDDGFSAHAVGWTSTTEVAWLVVAPDEAAVRRLMAAMQEAAG